MPKRSFVAPLVFVLLCLGGCMRSTDTAAASPRVECRLEAVPPLTAGGPVAVRLTLVNPTDAPVWALAWNTPFEPRWKGTIFELTRGGAEVPYTGPLTKRGEPGGEEYVEVPARGQSEATADLSLVYDVSQPGTYRLRVTGGLADLAADPAGLPRPRESHEGAALSCPDVEFEL
jgi:hypothetical protein